MGIGGAEWLERSEREIEELPETALDKIGLKPGWSWRMSERASVISVYGRETHRSGRKDLLAVDVQPEMLAILKDRAAKAKLTNIQPILDRNPTRISPRRRAI